MMKRFKSAVATALCLLAVITLMAGRPQISFASHEDTKVLADADGALDDDTHEKGVRFALQNNYVAGLMMMTEQFVSVMMQQMLIVGTFLDAKQQFEVQRLFQELSAQAHKDYHPGLEMCMLGTNVASLAASGEIGEENAQMLDNMIEKRNILHANLASAGGTGMDIAHRVKMFKDNYCDLDENNRKVKLMCGEKDGPVTRRTKDIDYNRMMDVPYTLDINYTDAQETDDEKDILGLANNLYASRVIDFMPEQLINESAGLSLFMESRSLQAMRSVARRSFTAIAGMKAEGDQDAQYKVKPFMYGIVKELGVPEAEIKDFLGENPSYFAQMEVLTRKIYQSPDFFVNLYDKPANVDRVGVALQAIELMQDRDRFESALRREMMISLILELKLRSLQEAVSNTILHAVTDKPDIPEL